MATFHLRSPSARKKSTIVCKFYYDNRRLTVSLGRSLSIEPKHWNPNTQRPRKSYPSYESLCAVLDSIETALTDRYNFLIAQGRRPTAADLEEALVNRSGKLTTKAPTLLDHLRTLTEKNSYRSQYRNLEKQVTDYLGNRTSFSLTDVDGAWYATFQQWLIDNVDREGYAYRVAKQLKTALRRSSLAWPGKAEVLDQKLIASDQPAESIYLSPADLERLYSADLSGDLSTARYLLLFACLTGLRLSDWCKYNPANAIEVGGYRFVRIVATKTRKERRVSVAYPPLLRFTETILEKLGGPIPDYSNESIATLLRRDIREACRAAGLIDVVEKIIRTKGETVSERRQRWELFSPKTGRTSFVSNLRSTGCPDRLISLMTGHSTGRTMTDVYDARKFQDVAPQIAPYLREFEKQLPGSSRYERDELTIF